MTYQYLPWLSRRLGFCNITPPQMENCVCHSTFAERIVSADEKLCLPLKIRREDRGRRSKIVSAAQNCVHHTDSQRGLHPQRQNCVCRTNLQRGTSRKLCPPLKSAESIRSPDMRIVSTALICREDRVSRLKITSAALIHRED
jgi:hypothetical protein